MRTEDTHRDENRAVNKRGRVKKGFGGFLGGGCFCVDNGKKDGIFIISNKWVMLDKSS